MIDLFTSLLAQLAIVLLGFPALAHPAMKTLGRTTRISCAYLLGSILLTFEGIVLSLAGQSWGERTLPLPFILAAAFFLWRWKRRTAPPLSTPVADDDRDALSMILIIAPAVFAVAFLLLAQLSTAAAASDFVLSSGTKAVRFAAARGIDFELLRSPGAGYVQPWQPPLLPITLAWNMLVLRNEIWNPGLILSTLWLLASIAPMYTLFRERLRRREALVSVSVWTVVQSLSLVATKSGGSSDVPYLCFASLAILAALVDSRFGRIVMPLALCGAMLTKTEGVLLLIVVALAWVIQASRRHVAASTTREALPLAATFVPLVIWWIALLVNEVAFPTHVRASSFFQLAHREGLNAVSGGTFALGWLIPLLFVLAAFRRLGHYVGGVIIVAGLLLLMPLSLFLGFSSDGFRGVTDFLFGRAFQPVASSLVLLAALVAFDRPRNGARGTEFAPSTD